MCSIRLEMEKDPLSFSKIILSAPAEKSASVPAKIVLTQKRDRSGKIVFFAEEFKENKAFHKHLSPDRIGEYTESALAEARFRQVNLFTSEAEIGYRISKKGKISRTVNRKATIKPADASHNREKNYLIRQGDPIPFMVDLGIFTQDFQIKSQMQDKFRQINRFVEILDHAFSSWDKDEIRVLDFGCGKSYLTFFVYYYFSAIRNKKVHIIGYDLKQDVVANCNALAKKYGYHGLEFIVADVTRDALTNEKIDFVISLHACDTATDFAIHFALEREVPYLFSVPCCQHEINQTIQKGDGDLDLFLRHGLIKERMSALLTDAMRASILECEGYHVDVLEFVDFAHSPKNLMLRARKKKGAKKKSMQALFDLEKTYGFRQTLLHLRSEEQ